MTCHDCQREIERLHAFIVKLAERLAAASEVLAMLAERKSERAKE